MLLKYFLALKTGKFKYTTSIVYRENKSSPSPYILHTSSIGFYDLFHSAVTLKTSAIHQILIKSSSYPNVMFMQILDQSAHYTYFLHTRKRVHANAATYRNGIRTKTICPPPLLWETIAGTCKYNNRKYI